MFPDSCMTKTPLRSRAWTLALLAALQALPAIAQEFPSEIELSALDGNNGFALTGVTASNAGSDVAGVGDFNGDGIDDLLIGARGADFFNGEAYVVFGRSEGFAAELPLTDFRDSQDGFTISGTNFASAGEAVGAAGDNDGDGLGDLLIGEPRLNLDGTDDNGASWIGFSSLGSGDRPLGEFFDAGLLGDIGGLRVGSSVDGAGDVDGDGLDDVVVGTFFRDIYVLTAPAFILPTDGLSGSNGFNVTGLSASSLRDSVSGAGDFNGDGIDDVVIAGEGNPFDPNDGTFDAYVIFGSNTGFAPTLDVDELDGTNGIRISDDRVGGGTDGVAVDGGGDVNGDGIADIAIGVPYQANDTGSVYVVYGNNGPFDATLDLIDLDGNTGFVINGVAEDDETGTSLSVTGDINQDGIADLLIGAPGASPDGRESAGKVYVVYGRSGGFGASIDLADLDGTNGFVINGENNFDLVGNVVSAAGDVNADGVGDVLIGVENANRFAGAAFVVYGQRTARVADIAVEVLASPDPAEQSAPIDYSVTVTNDGPNTATLVTVNSTLDACLSAPVTVGCLEDPIGLPTCTLPDIPAGESASFTITAGTERCAPTDVISTFEVFGDAEDPDTGNNATSTTTSLTRRSGDIDANGCIDRGDQRITVFAVRQGITNARFDVDGDGAVTFADVVFLTGLFDNPDGAVCD